MDSLIGIVKQLASKAVEHECALASIQQKMVTMEKVLEDLRNRKKEVPSYRDVANREGGRDVASSVREIEVASRKRYSEVSGRERGEEGASERGREVSGRDRDEEAAATVSGGRWLARREEKVKEMFREASLTLTFSPNK